MASWYFRKKSRGEVVREPIQGEFFSQDAVSSPGKALVREGIQNALDARRGDEKVAVRIAVVTNDMTGYESDATRWITGAVDHLRANQNGLRRDDLPDISAPCRDYLIFEDFGTTGLRGDPGQTAAFATPEPDRYSNFFNFFRADGQTEDKKQLGSWGVGKFVFWRTSRINAVLGLTISDQHPDTPLLMGRIRLRSHSVGDEMERNYQDGFYGRLESDDGFVMPIQSDSDIADFKESFRIKRKDEPGLSLVVPWPDEDIKKDHLLKAVIEDYFYPILKGHLIVTIGTSTNPIVLDSETIVKRASAQSDKIRRQIELAQWMLSADQHRYEINPDLWKPYPEWSNKLLSKDDVVRAGNDFHIGKKITFRVKVPIRPKNGRSAPSFFDVGLVRTAGIVALRSNDPVFVRNDIIIPDVRTPKPQETISLVVADDKHLSTFLRAAENPSHTQWQQSLLRGKYERNYGKILDFVIRSVYELVRIITVADENEDPHILADIFPMPARTVGPVDPPLSQVPKYRIQQTEGGFSVTHNPQRPVALPATLNIAVAYNVRRGSPLRKYSTDDFRIEAFGIFSEGLKIVEHADNRIRCEILSPEFCVNVEGFDKNRDIYVSANIQDSGNDDS